tara:strand:- start:719 stop:1114 length:396 start_codon:yes stop_codon:yes gene_type:complete
MKTQERKTELTNRLNKQQLELEVLLKAIEDKEEMDIKHYGVPLKAKVLHDKVEAKKRAIKKTQDFLSAENAKVDKRFSLSKRDKSILSAIRNDTLIGNTTSAKQGSRYDNRFAGSGNSRKQARLAHRREKE